MARVVLTASADADTAKIIAELAEIADGRVATRYNALWATMIHEIELALPDLFELNGRPAPCAS